MGQKAINPNDMNQQVYYDPSMQQYYTMNRDPIVWKNKETGQPMEASSNFAITPLTNLLYAMGLHGGNATRSYLNNQPIQNQIIAAQQTYPSVNQMFPSLASTQTNNLLAPTDMTETSGAGRFLSSPTSKGK